jgi:hypothetical protein
MFHCLPTEDHIDIGGGSVENGTPHTLARIPLRWMIRECFKTNTGIMFSAEGLRSVGLDPASLYPIVQPRQPRLAAGDAFIQRIPKSVAPAPATEPVYMSEEEHERLDAVAPIYDQLDLAWFWWLLEYFPMRQSHQKSDNTWVKEYCWNRGQGRHVPKQGKGTVKVHRSVQIRMEAKYEDGNTYEPKAKFTKALELGNVVWVD